MVIGISGVKGAGKDTAAQYFVDKYKFERTAFADKLKEAVAALFDIPREKVDEWKYKEQRGSDEISFVEVHLDIGGETEYVFSWREFLQRFGTEMGRNVFGPHFWTDLVIPKNFHLQYRQRNLVISDVRFDSEALRIVRLGGCVIDIERPGYGGDEHSSEQGIDKDLKTYSIYNAGTIEDLHTQLELAFQDWLERTNTVV